MLLLIISTKGAIGEDDDDEEEEEEEDGDGAAGGIDPRLPARRHENVPSITTQRNALRPPTPIHASSPATPPASSLVSPAGSQRSRNDYSPTTPILSGKSPVGQRVKAVRTVIPA